MYNVSILDLAAQELKNTEADKQRIIYITHTPLTLHSYTPLLHSTHTPLTLHSYTYRYPCHSNITPMSLQYHSQVTSHSLCVRSSRSIELHIGDSSYPTAHNRNHTYFHHFSSPNLLSFCCSWLQRFICTISISIGLP